MMFVKALFFLVAWNGSKIRLIAGEALNQEQKCNIIPMASSESFSRFTYFNFGDLRTTKVILFLNSVLSHDG